MIKKKDIYDRIVHELSIYANEIEAKAENNLLDDNVFSEDFIKDVLNTCMGWNLINLNTDINRFPGIDLGDKERHIGVQVTSTKTSKKVSDSLDKVVSNNVDKDYNEIYFFILGKRQNSYSVDFAKYDTLDCSESNIWDVSDIIAWCAHYDSIHMEQVWNVIKREIVVEDPKSVISIEIKKGILELKNVVHKVFEISNQLIQTHYASEKYIDEVNKSLGELDKMLPYLDEITYITCKEVLEDSLELGKALQTYQKWEWKIEAKCICIMYKILVEKNLQEASELIANNIPGLQNGTDIVIDGDSLFDRLSELKIDEDILYKQFSVMKFQKVIEDSILRKSKKCIIVFSTDNSHYNKDLICRLEAEGTQVVIFENRLQTIEFVYEQIKRTFELVLVSSSEDMVSKVSLEKDDCYLYTVSFENDLPTRSIPIFFSKGNITWIGLNRCFNYNECKTINIKNITESIYKEMLANANDCISHQLRVDWSGDVYISTITGAEEIDGVKFRWESWDPGNGYAGPCAASDHEYVKQSVASLKKCWEDGVRGYCDYYAIL
ncbi:SMEK domain-containing protein [Lacrimispora xylanisolvens]|uniref:SMEK domain-containing protein n=1 Tax=Lacrimispora xylanisolvens TaxID=384636 RepID=UPI0024026FC5